MPPNTIYVGRGSKWGNPFRAVKNLWAGVTLSEVRKVLTPEEAVARYKKYELWYLLERYDIEQLRGKNLCCWCKENEPCHADILLEIANKS